MSVTHTIRVRYVDCDPQNVVFHGNWLAYFDDACTRFFAALGYDPKELFTTADGFDFMVVGAELTWHGSAGFDDEVAIKVSCARIGTSSFALRYRSSVQGRPACDGLVTYVSVWPREHRSRPIPDAIRADLERHRCEPEPSQP